MMSCVGFLYVRNRENIFTSGEDSEDMKGLMQTLGSMEPFFYTLLPQWSLLDTKEFNKSIATFEGAGCVCVCVLYVCVLDNMSPFTT